MERTLKLNSVAQTYMECGDVIALLLQRQPRLAQQVVFFNTDDTSDSP